MDINPTAKAAQQPLKQKQLSAADAFATGADAVNRVGVLVNAALRIAVSSDPVDHKVANVTGMLKEVHYLTEDLGGMLESERDSAIAKEGK